MPTDRELIDEWLKTHEPTRCPPVHLLPSADCILRQMDSATLAVGMTQRHIPGLS